MNFGRTVVITTNILKTINSMNSHIRSDFWFSASINPTFLLIKNFEDYIEYVSYPRFVYNLNFPMNTDFIDRNIKKINIHELINHQFITDEVKNHICKNYTIM